MFDKKISVCIATYNGENYIKEQLTSILDQLKQDDEIIISDDGSTDRTLVIIEKISDPRIKIYHSSHRNVILNFENALGKATGNLIFLSDQDDIWIPSKVKLCLEHLRNNLLVFSNLKVFSDDLANSQLFFDREKIKTGILRNIIKNNYIGATMAFRKELLAKALPFPKNIYMHDIWLAMIAEVMGKTYFIEEPLLYYRRHGSNASQTGKKSSNPFLKKMGIRIVLIYNLIKRFL